jgi:peptide/nickel transport system substrate-binding protein
MRRRRIAYGVCSLRIRALASALVVTMTALVLAACSGGGGTSSSQNVATFALQPSYTPNYIFPLDSAAYFTVANLPWFQYLMFRPLYWFGQGGQPVANESLSLAKLPTWSNGGKTITITLKPYKWSNGTTVTAEDIQFWQNMVTANKVNWAAYVPGEYPDNVTSTKVISPTTIQFNLNKAYNHTWFLYNELSQVTPMPMAWDVTSAGAAPGSGGCTASAPKKCVAVYNYLDGQSKDVSSYASNPLWHIVDGPWKLQQYQTTGYSAFVPNPAYSGPVKPTLSKFVEMPFTTDAAEYNDITSGQGVDVGYLPFTDAPQKARAASLGYTVAPWASWSINQVWINYNNPTVGPMFRQLYIRQALEYVMNQPAVIKAYYNGYAYPTYGPVPLEPKTPFSSGLVTKNPYPYNPAEARKLITSHGWTIENGIATCTSPGAGGSQCGQGIKKGAQLKFQMLYASGIAALNESMQTYKSQASGAGIDINLQAAPVNSVSSAQAPCKVGPQCTWQMTNGGPWTYLPDYYPTGDEIFACGAGSNYGSYCDEVNDSNIARTETAPPSSSSAALATYGNYAAKDLPVIWEPQADYQITLVRNNLRGVTPQNASLEITPEEWRFSSAGG